MTTETEPQPAPPTTDGSEARTNKALRPVVTLTTAALCGLWIARTDGSPTILFLPQALLLVSVAYLIAIGAGWLVDAACRIAQRLGISYLVIGLTVVAMGTSAPELAASLLAGLQGNGDITVANVIGSNIFNLCFILGGIAVITGGLHVERALLVRDGPFLLLVSVLLFLFVGGSPVRDAEAPGAGALLDLQLGRVEGAILVATLAAYLYVLYRVLRTPNKHAGRLVPAKRAAVEPKPPAPERSSVLPIDVEALPAPEAVARSSTGRDLLWLLAGLVMVLGGSQLLVGQAELTAQGVRGFGALWFARIWNVPDYVVGVTIIAAGTSAPELVVSMVAALRGAVGMSAGNLIGSDLFNMLGVLGVCGLVLQPPLAPPVVLSAAVVPSLMALCGLIALMLLFMWTGRRISRAEGFIMLGVGVVRWMMDFGVGMAW